MNTEFTQSDQKRRERIKQIIDAKEAGERTIDIAIRFGITPVRVDQIMDRYEYEELFPLAREMRTRPCLMCRKMHTTPKDIWNCDACHTSNIY